MTLILTFCTIEFFLEGKNLEGNYSINLYYKSKLHAIFLWFEIYMDNQRAIVLNFNLLIKRKKDINLFVILNHEIWLTWIWVNFYFCCLQNNLFNHHFLSSCFWELQYVNLSFSLLTNLYSHQLLYFFFNFLNK